MQAAEDARDELQKAVDECGEPEGWADEEDFDVLNGHLEALGAAIPPAHALGVDVAPARGLWLSNLRGRSLQGRGEEHRRASLQRHQFVSCCIRHNRF